MKSKEKAAIIIAAIGVIGAAAGGAFVFDFSTTITEIGQIGDINTIIQNNLGVNMTEFKRMCDAGEVHEEFEQYCGLI